MIPNCPSHFYRTFRNSSMTQMSSLHLLPFQDTCLYLCFTGSIITNLIWKYFFSFLIFFLAFLVRSLFHWPLCTILFPVVLKPTMLGNPVYLKKSMKNSVCCACTNGMCKLWGLLTKEWDYRGITGSYREALRYLRPQVSTRPQQGLCS